MQLDWQNVVVHDGWGLTAAGMGIVFTALVLICLYIAVLPKILVWVNRWLPETEGLAHETPPKSKPVMADTSPLALDEAPLAAAAAAAMHAHAKGKTGAT